MTSIASRAPKIAVPTRYPFSPDLPAAAVVSPSQVIDTVSPPVSPSVVQRILMIQKPSVTAGTLVRASLARSSILGLLRVTRVSASGVPASPAPADRAGREPLTGAGLQSCGSHIDDPQW